MTTRSTDDEGRKSATEIMAEMMPLYTMEEVTAELWQEVNETQVEVPIVTQVFAMQSSLIEGFAALVKDLYTIAKASGMDTTDPEAAAEAWVQRILLRAQVQIYDQVFGFYELAAVEAVEDGETEVGTPA